ncbi:helix-turn-helix transcriptional regulator [Microvirga sp. BT688]|uniref:helix-turn-helix domain-containing protein n=1 Tax=Microvirga sp. TaxID=1873136 RepID=UPI0016866CCE|nr:AraC family transcriptional regulator [Microvirga sp.]MBD2750577.1 helix-turn-helix transcriptional regulator [Microvirga sp.]
MNRDDVVTLQARNRLTADTLRLSHGWGVLEAEHVAMLRPQPHDFSLHSSRHYLAWLNVYRRDGETFADDLPRSTLRDARSKLVFIPAGCRLQGWAEPGTAPIAFTGAYLDPAIGSWLEAGEPVLAPMLHFEHPLLAQLMLQLDRILAQPENYSRMYVEAFATVLLAEVMACQAVDLKPGHRTEWHRPAKGGLASWQRKAVCDYIEENLQQDISLAELAAIARLSPYHFCRAFKEAVGEPPHRYQMSRRIEQAKTLLAKPSLSVSDVAATVGYGSLSRFSALFRQTTGHSPREYRRKMI